MRYYVDAMIKEFPYELKSKFTRPWTENILKIEKSAKSLNDECKKIFHTFVMKAMFLSKRGRPDVNNAISILSSRVKESNEGYWKKLLHVKNFFKNTRDDIHTLEADNSQELKWYVDAAFAVRPAMKSHTGAVFTLGKGAIISDSTKQKSNARSSTEAELNGVDDKISKNLWSKKFIEYKGFKVKVNVIYQDNTSTMKRAQNGKASSGKGPGYLT